MVAEGREDGVFGYVGCRASVGGDQADVERIDLDVHESVAWGGGAGVLRLSCLDFQR